AQGLAAGERDRLPMQPSADAVSSRTSFGSQNETVKQAYRGTLMRRCLPRLMSAMPLTAAQKRTSPIGRDGPIPDSCTATYVSLFDHLVGRDKQSEVR